MYFFAVAKCLFTYSIEIVQYYATLIKDVAIMNNELHLACFFEGAFTSGDANANFVENHRAFNMF